MGTIAKKLAYTIEAKDGIRAAIVGKGVDVPSNTPLGQYGSLIEEIQSGGGSGGDEQPPVIERVEIHGATLMVKADTMLKSDAPADAFVVTVNGEATTVLSVAVSQDLYATLTLGTIYSNVTIGVKVKASAFKNTHSDTSQYNLSVGLLDAYMSTTVGMTDHSFSSDDGQSAYDIPKGVWKLNGADITSASVSGNSQLSFTSSLYVNVNNRDTYIRTYYTQDIEFNGANGLKCNKCRWEGWSPYNSKVDAYKYVWEVFLFSNGDAMINLVSKGAGTKWTGTFVFCGASYTLDETNKVVSFYRVNEAGVAAADWRVVNAVYEEAA